MLDRKWLLIGSCAVLTILAPGSVHAQAARLLVPNETHAETSTVSGISPLELQQFVQALKQMQTIDLESQKQMAAIIQKEGLKLERFVEIDRANSSGVAPEKPVSDGEQQRYNSIVTKIQKVWQDSQPKKERAITGQGLTVARFGEINNQVRSDRALQEKVKQMIGTPPVPAQPTGDR
ncbi:DUF4168 domain-containing protein [Pannus brasiliensis CCIBt3594]|uniref:DUF4168 domain-containing protein n=1 Tax=Pannus brasiliensis CCIBt3594 TaxID=1427578 RepID=A0AAW9QMJ6_9CHRO